MGLIDADVLIRDINADPYRTESEKSYDRCLVHRQPTVDAVVLPCKVGEKAFWACRLAKKVYPFTVDSFIVQKDGLYVRTHLEDEFPWKECSLTHAEAKSALAKMKGGASDD